MFNKADGALSAVYTITPHNAMKADGIKSADYV